MLRHEIPIHDGKEVPDVTIRSPVWHSKEESSMRMTEKRGQQEKSGQRKDLRKHELHHHIRRGISC